MAGSIKFLEFVQKFHQTIGICPYQPIPKQCITNRTKSVFLLGFTQFMFTAAAFLVFKAKSIFEYGFSFYTLIGILNATVIYLIFIWQSENTLKFIENCEEFIKKRDHLTVEYKDLIGKIDRFTKLFSYAMGWSFGFLYFAILPYSFIRYFIFDMGKESFHLFSPSWYPFDWKTPAGYLIVWLAQCVGAAPAASTVTQFLNLMFGSCWLFIFIAEDITQDVVAFNILVEKASPNKNCAELKKCFCDTVQIYLDAKQCINNFNQINEYSLFVFFSWDMLGAASILVTLQFQLWADEWNLFEFIPIFLVLIWLTIYIFLLCEPGARMTDQFDKFSVELSQCDWHLFPIEMRRMYIIFLLDTQNSMKILSYANITSERDTSKKMFNTAFSYFMTIRRFRA